MKITIDKAVVEQVIEALESDNPDVQLRAAIALRAALNEASKEVEPVAWMFIDDTGMKWVEVLKQSPAYNIPLYTHPAPAVPEGWQPIETAPKDGAMVLLWADGQVEIGDCIPDAHPWNDGAWWIQGRQITARNPTHWMPLPAAPEVKK